MMIWLITLFFADYQFFLQLSSGVIVNDVMKAFSLTALGAGTLSSIYYYVYILLQTPAGLLMDRYDSRWILAAGSLLCGSSCMLFSQSTSFPVAIFARLMMGTGSAFAFVGCVHCIRMWFPSNRFGLMVGYTETFGMLVTVLGSVLLAIVLQHLDWRTAMFYAGTIGLIICALITFIVRDKPREHHAAHPDRRFSRMLKAIITHPMIWLNGIYCGLAFGVLCVFGSLWGIPFLQIKLQCSLTVATMISTFLFLGTAAGSPLLALLAHRYSRRMVLVGAPICAVVLVMMVLFLPTTHVSEEFILFFLLGMSCSSYVLNFEMANELAPATAKSTSIGFTNALCVSAAPILQPAVGYLLFLFAHGQHNAIVYSLDSYQHALLILPLMMLTAMMIGFQLPEKTRHVAIHNVSSIPH